jgi:hypothetical protein
MEINVDSNLDWKVKNQEFEPIIFVPDVDLFALKDDSIIDSF